MLSIHPNVWATHGSLRLKPKDLLVLTYLSDVRKVCAEKSALGWLVPAEKGEHLTYYMLVLKVTNIGLDGK